VLRSVTGVRAFTRLCSYYPKLIGGFAEIAAPLHDLTKKIAQNTIHQTAFDELKNQLTSTPILALPNDSNQYILDTDVSDSALGAVLSEVQDGQVRLMAYASRRYLDVESRYCITHRELLTVVYGLRRFRVYLLGLPLQDSYRPCTVNVAPKDPDVNKFIGWI